MGKKIKHRREGEKKLNFFFGWRKKYSLKNLGRGLDLAVFKSVFFCELAFVI